MKQLLLHAIGDYLIQNDWMALNKKKSGWNGFLACFVHCLTYSLPFYLIADTFQVSMIFLTHFIIDRWRLVDYFLAIKNNVKNDYWRPLISGFRFIETKYDISNFGFSKERPQLITVWLYIITDNIFHLICNYLILSYL